MDFDLLLEKKYAPYLILIFIALIVYALIYALGGEFGVGAHNWWNNYSRQTYSWLQGRLDIPYNRPYLEIAFFGDRMYMSFPPFPSIFLIPFVLIFGYNTPDHAIALGLALVSNIYAYKIALHFLKEKKAAMFFTLFLILGTNYLHISLWGSVWYMAQNMAFTLLLISIYYALTDKNQHSVISLLALCASMGCRPFNAIYLPVILYLIAKRENLRFFETFVKKLVIYAIPAIMLGIFYMWLNYVRFGNIFEFGHNFLPEFTIDLQGQFHPSRIARNLRMMLIGLDISYPIRNGFPHVDRTTFAIWLASPIFISFIIYRVIYQKKFIYRIPSDILLTMTQVLVTMHILAFSLHRTLGGRQFGSRYVVDSLPIVFLGLMYMVGRILKENRDTVIISRHMLYNAVPFAFGTLINFHGTIMFFAFYFPIYNH